MAQNTTHWFDTKNGKALATIVFKITGLVESEGTKRETGTLSNETIARRFDNPVAFLKFMMRLYDTRSSEAEARSIASLATDLM